MTTNLRQIIFTIILNSTLFSILIIGIQNSSKKGKVNLLINESVALPVSFIIGLSFISGSISGSFISFMYSKKK